MTDPEPPKPLPPASNGDRPPSAVQLDVTRLHSLPSEQQSLYLLTFTADLLRHVDALDDDAAAAQQTTLRKELSQLIALSSPAPARVVRNNIGRCWAGIFGRSHRKGLDESIHELVAIVQAGKERDRAREHAAASSLGAAVKAASTDTGYRGAIFTAMGKIAVGIKTALDEDVARSVWKLARTTAAGDKSWLVQASACHCLQQLVRSTSYFDNSNDFERLQAALWKCMESAAASVRHAAASCLTLVLFKSYMSYTDSPDAHHANAHAVPRLKKPKAKRTVKSAKGEEPEDEMDRTASPAPEKPATALSYSLLDALRVLSTHYCRPTTTNKARAGVAVCYVRLLKALGESVIEKNYGDIARHCFHDILSHPSMQSNRYRQLMGRKFVRVILERVMGKMLGETAQLNACRYLLNDIIKDYPPAIKERPEPSKQTLTGAISALTSMMESLDAAVHAIAEQVREGLLQVLQHPNFTVQIHTARALRAFVLACPQQLLPTVTICMNSVSRELTLLAGPRQAPKRCVGYAHGLAAVLSTSSLHPLYGSVDVYARVLQQATSLLKSSGSSDLRISSCQLQVAWIMIGGLMSLGPNFVKIHLSQLMLLWRNALPKPVPKENMSQRNMIELSYLAHVRECALGSVKAFLTFNQRLLTVDVSKRLSAMLENTVTFIQALPEKKTSDDPANRLSPALQLQDYEIMVRRRVFQCFSQLLTLTPLGSIESTAHSTILPLAVASFSDVEYYSPSSLSAAIASAAAAFESIWDVGDNNGFGLSGLIHGRDVMDPVTRKVHKHWSSRQEDEAEIDRVVLSPIGDAPEHDPTCCYLPADSSLEEPNPPGTEAVNAAIAAFGLCLPLQAPRVQESALEQITSSLGSASLQKDPARRAAIAVNVALALNTVCNVSIGESGSAKGDLKRDATENALVDLLHTCIKDPEECVRQLAADALGALCCSSGNLLTTNEITWLTETIVKNREPHVRAGCALALASIHSQLGGMAAGYHMKQIVGILVSLAADTHPLVHCWALDALARVAESAGLGYSAYVTTTIGMLSQLYVSDSHTSETAVLASSNMSLELPVTAAIARGVDSIINVLGPDLQDMTKARDMILTLVRLMLHEATVGVRLEGLRCMEHLSLYAPGHLEFARYVRYLQRHVESDDKEISRATLHGLSVLMRRDASEIVRTAHPGLEDKLWDYLNSSPHQQDVLNIFRNWLTQTGSIDPAEWIQRCNTVLTKSKSKIEAPKTAHTKSAVTAGPEVQDEEVAGFAVAAGATREDDAQAPTSTQELMRWQVRLFAMELLQELIAVISKEAAVSDDSPGEAALQSKVADVVRIAFSASTAGVAALRVVGMRIIDQILKLFGRTPDPDFPEAMLLEQYQAQISSALTPAFAADSSPELAAAAVSVCATFIATGIVTDIDRMGRILKVLVSALDSFSKDAESASIGDLRALSSNALVMVRMAVFSAWAKLQIASAEQSYLVEVVRPHIAQLVPLWLSSLREFSRLRFEPDISASMGTPVSGDLDMVYAALNRETLLTFYQDSWLSLVDAIASLIDEDSEFVFDALDNKHASTTGAGEGESESSPPNGVHGVARKNTGINYREEPVAFFFVLFGLAFESLAVRSADDSVVTTQRNTDILQALKKILRPSVSGNAVYQEVVFSETVDLLSRMVLTESLGVQALVVDIARNLCIVHPSSRQGLQTPVNGEALSDDIEQLFELTRIIVLVLGNLIPGLADSPAASPARLESSEETISLVRTSLQALVDVSDVFPSIIKTDLDASILHVFVTILGTAACQASVVPQSLPIFRRFIVSIAETDHPRQETSAQLRNALSRMLIILKNAQKRESDASLPCERNCLLAITVLLSAAPQTFTPTDPLLARFISELADSLSGPKTSRVAAGCLRTLLLAHIAPAALLAHAITFVLHPVDLDGVTETRPLMAQTLTAFAAKLAGNPDQHAATVALVLNVLLDRAAKEGEGVYAETAGRVLELVGEGAVFRSVVAGFGAERKALMERVLRSAGGGSRGGGVGKGDAEGEREPRIALRLDFGGG
ncbi:HEAT repeat protein [Teratosphaeria destructans]|uniref:HEAT repeat protein n=1 Tax=Teratosphaeria destructans TaxID=418781 RepID=A0A9W7W4C9_9PEZI|nr:HEAT repeat protein [Teratosphaeria destructans]